MREPRSVFDTTLGIPDTAWQAADEPKAWIGVSAEMY